MRSSSSERPPLHRCTTCGPSCGRGTHQRPQQTISLHNCTNTNWGNAGATSSDPSMLCSSAKLLCRVSRGQQVCRSAASPAVRVRHAAASASARSTNMAGCQRVTFGDAVPGYVWGTPGQPGVVLLQEWWGVNEQVRCPALSRAAVTHSSCRSTRRSSATPPRWLPPATVSWSLTCTRAPSAVRVSCACLFPSPHMLPFQSIKRRPPTTWAPWTGRWP